MRDVRVGEKVALVRGRRRSAATKSHNYFVTMGTDGRPTEEEVRVPLGTVLDFPCIEVRMYDEWGSGSYGYVPKNFLRVTFAEDDKRNPGLLLPEGDEDIGGGEKIHRSANVLQFTNLSGISIHVPTVVQLPA